jgi:hypothetical protein
MNAETLEALQASIAKYRNLASLDYDSLRARVLTGHVSFGAASCPLCNLFLYGSPTCGGCPIVERVYGLTHCEGTPWRLPRASSDMRVQLPELLERTRATLGHNAAGADALLEQLSRRCREECEFLESLLPDATSPGQSPLADP